MVGCVIVFMLFLLLVGELMVDYIIMLVVEIEEFGILIGFEYYIDILGVVEFYVNIFLCFFVKYIVFIVSFIVIYMFFN